MTNEARDINHHADWRERNILRSCKNCVFFNRNHKGSSGKCGNVKSDKSGKELFQDDFCEEWSER